MTSYAGSEIAVQKKVGRNRIDYRKSHCELYLPTSLAATHILLGVCGSNSATEYFTPKEFDYTIPFFPLVMFCVRSSLLYVFSSSR